VIAEIILLNDQFLKARVPVKISKALLTILLFFVSFQAALLAQPPLAGSNQAEGAC